MNKNKIIFAILGSIILVVVLFVAGKMNSSGGLAKTSSLGTVSIWTVEDDSQKFNEFLANYTLTTKNKITFDVKSFPNYTQYYYSLLGAFLKGEGPDVFVLNNNDSESFKNNILGLDPSIVSVDDFKKNFDMVFQDDLIKFLDQEDQTKLEYLQGIPMGYKIPMMFFNFSLVKGTPTSTWSDINSLVSSLKEKGNNGIAFGDGSSISHISNIFTQLLILDSTFKKISTISLEEIKKNIVFYKGYFLDESGINENNYSQTLENSTTKKDYSMLTSQDVAVIFGMPNLLENIDKSIGTTNKTLIRARPFPTFEQNKGNILVDYNYFVINKNTKNLNGALSLLNYFQTKEAQSAYLKTFAYYLPSRLDLMQTRLEEHLKPGYSIKYKDFYNNSLNYMSFDKSNKDFYDNEIQGVFDLSMSDGIKLFDNFRKRVLCLSNSISNPMGENAYCK